MFITDKHGVSLIRAVLFDLDGVLIDSYHAWFHLFNDALKHFGFPVIPEPVFRKHWGQSTEQDIKIFMPGRTIREVRQYFIEHYGDYLSFITCDPDAFSVLCDLRARGLLLGCVTNSHREITETILRQHKIQECFDLILTADDVISPKPAPEILLKACGHLGIDMQAALFIGDTRTDIKAGKDAGCVVVGYRIAHPISVQTLVELRDLMTSVMPVRIPHDESP